MSELFYFLRQLPPDVLRYLPPFLANDKLFKTIQDTLSWEHERYRVKLAEIAKQFYLETADAEGLKDWEKFLAITPTSNDIEQRRTKVRVRRRADTVLTVENTQRLLEEFAPFGSISIEELGDNRLKFNIENGNFHWDELLVELFHQLPAHLSFDFSIDFAKDSPIYVAQVEVDAGDIAVNLNFENPGTTIININHNIADSGDIFVKTAEIQPDYDNDVAAGFSISVFEDWRIGIDSSEFDDEERRAAFEAYLKRQWQAFKNNAVIKHYTGDDGELDDGDEETFPVQVDFLRLYWQFDDSKLIRYTTHYNPRTDLTESDILTASIAGRGVLMHSKLQTGTTGILRALYVSKIEEKVL